MKRIISLFVIVFAIFQSALAQDIVTEGAPYYLPKTAFKFRILVQKTKFTPGEYAEYAARYLKQTDAVLEPKTSYKIIDLKMQPIGVPDPSKHYRHYRYESDGDIGRYLSYLEDLGND